MSNAILLSPGDAFEKYTVVRELGHGGMGAVYLVHHPVLDSDFALKVLFPEVAQRDRQFVERFIREARLAGRIHHQNLIAVHDAGVNEKNGMYYLVMDFVAGGSVRDKLKKNHYVDMLEAISIVRQVAAALEAAQKHNMVHRDIKPDNIMFDAQGVVKLADLGIAKATDDRDTSLTIEASVFGTPAYMSPEQARDSSKVDTRADIYSLGVVFFEMLTGRRPFSGNTSIEILTQVIDDKTAPDVRTYSENIPEDVARLVADMLVKDRDKRISSPTELIRRIDALDLSAYQEQGGCGEDSPDVTMPTMVSPVAAQPSAPPPPTDVTMPTMASPAPAPEPKPAPDVTMPTMAAPAPEPKTAPEVPMPTMAAPAPQTEVAPPPPPKPSAPASKQKQLILFAASVVVLLCIGGGLFFLRGGKKETPVQPPVPETPPYSFQTETIPTPTPPVVQEVKPTVTEPPKTVEEPTPPKVEQQKQELPKKPTLKTLGSIEDGSLVLFGAENASTTAFYKALAESGSFQSVAFQEASKDVKAWCEQLQEIQGKGAAFILIAVTNEKNNLHFKRMLAESVKLLTANTGAFLVSSGDVGLFDEVKDACNPTGIYFRKWASSKELVSYVQELQKELGW